MKLPIQLLKKIFKKRINGNDIERIFDYDSEF